MSAVLFDLDGTLADTEPLSQAAWTATLAEHGYTLTDDDLAALPGRGFSEIYERFAARATLPEEQAIWDAHSGRLFEAIDAELTVFDDAVRVVHQLADDGVPLALVSASRRPRVQRTLRAAGLDGRFDVLVCGGEVPRPKPAPDGYLAAARELGVDPGRCVVIEDTEPGVLAGLSAGTRVIALGRTGPVAAHAHVHAPRLELALVLEQLERAAA